MTYEWHDHTAELELRLESETIEGIFADALAALGELIGEAQTGEPETRTVTVSAPDRSALLVAWLEELVFLAESEDLVPERAPRITLRGHELTATVEGRLGRPRHLVKAVTYHGLRLEGDGGRWRATVVLDV